MKIIKLTESDLKRIVKKVLIEQRVSPSAERGQKNDDVKKIQQALKFKGYNLGTTGPNEDGVDGNFGPATQRAVKDFQSRMKLSPTGVVNQQTRNYLFTGFANSQFLSSLPGANTLQKSTGAKTQTTTGKSPSEINSFPSCVRFSKPTNDSATLNKIYNLFGSNYGNWFIKGTGFYEGYSFFSNGTYVSIGNSKKGTYTCNQNGKVILDIAAKAANSNTKKSGDYKYSPRIDAEVQHIKNRKMDDTPFIVYDPRENLIYLFNTGGVYVTSSSVVDGADAQKGLSDAKAFTREDWCKISNMESKPELCTDPKTGRKTKPFYGPIANLSSRFLPKGIYTINGLIYNEGYVGGSRGGAKNQFGLKPIKLEGTITAAAQKGLSAAIHGIPGESGRLKASKELETALKADVNSGKVPPQYLDNIKAILDANRSFGCIGVPASFVNNPKVQSIISANVNKIKVFAMGEDSQDFLVKNDGNQGNDQINLA
jgi:peptidoglycan hydrolase-like protein with peptidoglycan-binding domain